MTTNLAEQDVIMARNEIRLFHSIKSALGRHLTGHFLLRFP